MQKDKVNIISKACSYQRKLAQAGFDWPDETAVMNKIREELAELEEAILQQEPFIRTEEEYGDLLLVVLHLANHLNIEPEKALIKAQSKLNARYEKMMSYLGDKEVIDVGEMQSAWDYIKQYD